MCRLCRSEEFKNHVVDNVYEELRLKEGELDLGAFGELNLEMNIVMSSDEDDEYFLEAGVYLNNDIDCSEIIKIPMKYCPFCGRELA